MASFLQVQFLPIGALILISLFIVAEVLQCIMDPDRVALPPLKPRIFCAESLVRYVGIHPIMRKKIIMSVPMERYLNYRKSAIVHLELYIDYIVHMKRTAETAG